jgi:imidazolonepropionase-like amidohydrolase
MTDAVLICGKVFDGLSEALTSPTEILIEGNRISRVDRSVGRAPGAQVIDLADWTVSPGFIDTHVHLTMDATRLAAQTLESSASKALKALSMYVLATKQQGESVCFPVEGVDGGSISMLAVQVG